MATLVTSVTLSAKGAIKVKGHYYKMISLSQYKQTAMSAKKAYEHAGYKCFLRKGDKGKGYAVYADWKGMN